MNIQQSYHRSPFDPKICHVVKSRNDLDITRIDYIKDAKKSQLVIFLESDLLQDLEAVDTLIQENNLIIEAPRSMEYEKPIRAHLIDIESLLRQEKGIVGIGFSEVKLKPGFRYTVLSCQMINPGLLKVILSFHQIRKKSVNTIN